uniref:Odorant receptor n=1 Tax=Eogystia hippophaecolus TaxID=1206364 RepID=A0A1B3P5P8_EOGHI|nr:odorant receptor [Eogystia hippophaecolus]
MLKNFVSKLENPDHPSLGPTLWGLQAFGLWQPTKGVANIIYNLKHIFLALFIMRQYVELWIVRSDLDLVLTNLSKTVVTTFCVIKAGTFVFWQKRWRDVIEYVSTLERRQLSEKDDVTKTFIGDYIKYSRNITYMYWFLAIMTVFSLTVAPILVFFLSSKHHKHIKNETMPYPQIMDSWVPFDKSSGYGYWFTVLEATFVCYHGGGIVATYDSNALVIMSFFAGQLKLLKANCARLFGDGVETVTHKDAMKRIRDCHSHHLLLIKCSKILNSLLSPVMFLYVIICSLMICGSAIQLTTEGTTGMQQLYIAEFVVALIAQLFLYCWHSNDVLYVSETVQEDVYASNWWSTNVRTRRSLVLLGGQLRRKIVFEAGPFTELTTSTFITILKGAYSYYTLLSNKGN